MAELLRELNEARHELRGKSRQGTNTNQETKAGRTTK